MNNGTITLYGVALRRTPMETNKLCTIKIREKNDLDIPASYVTVGDFWINTLGMFINAGTQELQPVIITSLDTEKTYVVWIASSCNSIGIKEDFFVPWINPVTTTQPLTTSTTTIPDTTSTTTQDTTSTTTQPATTSTTTQQGTTSTTTQPATTSTTTGILCARFDNPTTLSSDGSNLHVGGNISGTPGNHLTVIVTDYIHTHDGSTTVDGTPISAPGGSFPIVLDGSGNYQFDIVIFAGSVIGDTEGIELTISTSDNCIDEDFDTQIFIKTKSS